MYWIKGAKARMQMIQDLRAFRELARDFFQRTVRLTLTNRGIPQESWTGTFYTLGQK